MDNMTFAVWVSDRLHFSDNDKRACFETAATIVDMAVDVRRNGLLSLDAKIPSIPEFLLREGIRLAVDSTDPETLRELMQRWVIAGDYRDAELLRRLVIIDGVLAIVNGENPNSIRIRLGTFFGEDLQQEFSEYGKNNN